MGVELNKKHIKTIQALIDDVIYGGSLAAAVNYSTATNNGVSDVTIMVMPMAIADKIKAALAEWASGRPDASVETLNLDSIVGKFESCPICKSNEVHGKECFNCGFKQE